MFNGDEFRPSVFISFPDSPNGASRLRTGEFSLLIVKCFLLKEILRLQEDIVPEGKELTHFLHNFFMRQLDFLPSF